MIMNEDSDNCQPFALSLSSEKSKEPLAVGGKNIVGDLVSRDGCEVAGRNQSSHLSVNRKEQ